MCATYMAATAPVTAANLRMWALGRLPRVCENQLAHRGAGTEQDRSVQMAVAHMAFYYTCARIQCPPQ